MAGASPTPKPLKLSNPVLFYKNDLKPEDNLTAQIIDRINVAFQHPRRADPEKWDTSSMRFKSLSGPGDLLGEDGVLSVIFDENGDDTGADCGRGRAVACGAAIPWKGGWLEEGKGTEVGWELKTVCVDPDVRYARTGLAGKVVSDLENYVVGKEIERIKKSGDESRSRATVKLWVLVAECLIGPYWRKRGYTEVRKHLCGPGVWGCKTSFEMVVLVKELEYDITS